jgi:nucleoside-diphosphate-sugar epimerase
MKILVTGSEGNIGSKLVPYLIECGHQVFCVDIKQSYRDNYIISDVTNPIDSIKVFNEFKPEVVIHLAAMVSRITCEKSASITISSNLLGLSNIIELCKLHNSKLIYFSTSEVYGNIGGVLSEDRIDIQPNNRYGLTKLMGERLVEYEVKYHNLKAVTLRPFMFYDEDESFGENRSAMIRFIEGCISNSEKLQVHKNSKRSWTHIYDAVRLIEKSIYLENYEVINIANSEVIDMEDFANKVINLSNKQFDDVFDIIPQPQQMTLEKIPFTGKMDRLLGYKPVVRIDEGLKLVYDKVKKRIGV